MKKLLLLAITAVSLFATSNQAFAVTNVSEMATTKGGKHVAQCAQKMDRGISECAIAVECETAMQ